MKINKVTYGLFVIIYAFLVSGIILTPVNADCMTIGDFKTKIADISKDLKDLTMQVTIKEKNKKALAKMEASYARLYDFNSAKVSFMPPNKIRTEGKLGMVRFEYIINDTKKIARSATIRFNRVEDYAHDPGKLQDALDMGLLIDGVWKFRQAEVVNDQQAEANNEVNLRFSYKNSDTKYLYWMDAQTLCLKRFEKRTRTDVLKIRIEYSKPVNIVGNLWMPTRTEMYTSDGEKVGATEYTDLKVNTNISESIFN